MAKLKEHEDGYICPGCGSICYWDEDFCPSCGRDNSAELNELDS